MIEMVSDKTKELLWDLYECGKVVFSAAALSAGIVSSFYIAKCNEYNKRQEMQRYRPAGVEMYDAGAKEAPDIQNGLERLDREMNALEQEIERLSSRRRIE